MKVLFGHLVTIIVVNSGTGNKTNFNVPQKILGIPPVLSVSCGSEHTLIITNDSSLWSCGNNAFGQLCHGDKEPRSKPQKTSFSNITKISAGPIHSLFQNNKGEIFSCGNNGNGQCGLGHFTSPQIIPSRIYNLPSNIVPFVCEYMDFNIFMDDPHVTPSCTPSAPSNIVHFVCGGSKSLFLDSEGNVYSVGDNFYGQLGLGHNRNRCDLNKIPNIPPIKTISCVYASCYLIDFEGNLWTFGHNDQGQLGHGDTTDINTPKMINTLKDIQQISYGSCGKHFLAKNSQNQIFTTGKNDFGQLGTGGDTQSVSTPKEINSQYSTIWRDEFHTRAKSARK